MDESVEVSDDIGVQVVDNANGKLSGYALVFVDLAKLTCSQFAHQQLALHVEVVVCQFSQLTFYF